MSSLPNSGGSNSAPYKAPLQKVLQSGLANRSAGNQVYGSLGVYGGFSVNSDASVKVIQGNIGVEPSPGNTGAYRIVFPELNKQIVSIDWFDVAGFTPRNPNVAETATVRCTGYNQDATTGEWYITVQIALLSDNSLDATPPANFVISVRAAFTVTSS